MGGRWGGGRCNRVKPKAGLVTTVSDSSQAALAEIDETLARPGASRQATDLAQHGLAKALAPLRVGHQIGVPGAIIEVLPQQTAVGNTPPDQRRIDAQLAGGLKTEGNWLQEVTAPESARVSLSSRVPLMAMSDTRWPESAPASKGGCGCRGDRHWWQKPTRPGAG